MDMNRSDCTTMVPGRRHVPRGREAGFSLIEVMIVVVIIAVLAAIAYPAYDIHTVKTRRATAAACLMERAQFAERFYTTNLTYTGMPDPAQCDDVATFYQIAAVAAAASATTYTFEAVPQGAQATKDTRCGTLSLNQTGTRAITGTGTVDECW